MAVQFEFEPIKFCTFMALHVPIRFSVCVYVCVSVCVVQVCACVCVCLCVCVL